MIMILTSSGLREAANFKRLECSYEMTNDVIVIIFRHDLNFDEQATA
jgi:hypothetical protein